MGRYVCRQLQAPDMWSVKGFSLYRNDKPLGLRVGMGFWGFDLLDDDSVDDLTFFDRLVLWPVAWKLRCDIKLRDMEKS
jgi:hypothetical protein